MPSPGAFALLAAAYVVAELVRRSDDELLPEALESERFSLSAPVHLAAILVVGAWPAALLGALGTLLVRPLKGERGRILILRAAGLALAALAGGYAAQLAGATPGSLDLSRDLLAIALLGMVYGTVRSLSLSVGGGRGFSQPDVLTTAAEVGLGLVLAYAALENAWLVVAVVPVLLLLDHTYGRIVQLRREMAAALETFANIVDERDPTTHGHSVRVAAYVSELAEALGLPRGEVSRLWWAGRLHDLGKVAVDAALLRKPGKLTPAEWGAVWRAPRLSARLLQRFRFAAQQAQAVEYHRERYDGSGYYGVRSEDTPLAAHFLIVADAFDAMTTDRAFRERLSDEEALKEIERGSGSQFHPVVAKAFVAVRRGQDPGTVLPPETLRELREAPAPTRPTFSGGSELRQRPELIALAGGAAALAGAGMKLVELAAFGALVAAVGIALWARRELLARRVGHALDEALAGAGDQRSLFDGVVASVSKAWPVSYAALVAWDDDGSGGSVVHSTGEEPPAEPTLVSWLLREAESSAALAVDVDEELGAGTISLALPVRRENSALVGFVVVRGSTYPPPHLLRAVGGRLDRLSAAIGGAAAAASPEPEPAREAELHADRRQHARPLEA